MDFRLKRLNIYSFSSSGEGRVGRIGGEDREAWGDRKAWEDWEIGWVSSIGKR